MSNIQSLLTKEAAPKLEVINKRRTKHTYQVNRNVSVGLMKNMVILMFLFKREGTNKSSKNTIAKIVDKLTTQFTKNIEPIRKNRTVKRKKRKRNQRGKFRTLTNYRKAI